MTAECLEHYTLTQHFAVVDTVGVPHPFTVGVKHVAHAADNFGGVLDERTLRKIPCAHKGCTFSYNEHKHALLVKCLVEPVGPALEELHEYLLTIAPLAEADGYAGFVFLNAYSEQQ